MLKWVGVVLLAVVAVGVFAINEEPASEPITLTTTTADPYGQAVAAELAKNAIPEGGGVYQIGVDINAGRWRTAGPSDDDFSICYYATTPTPDGGSDIDQQGVTEGPAIVDLPAGQFFHTSGCQTWMRD